MPRIESNPSLASNSVERERGIVERMARCQRHRTWHVGDAVMDDAIDLIGRVVVRGWVRGLEAAALINGHVHEDRCPLHGF